MIAPGDKFTVIDLRESVRLVCDCDIRKWIAPRLSPVGIMLNDRPIMPAEYTPDEYAQMCIHQYDDNPSNSPSSAIHLDEQLRASGFKTTHRFAHKYRLGRLTPDEIVYDAYRLEWFYYIGTTTVPYVDCESEFDTAINDAFHVSYYYAQYLWSLNPRAMRPIAAALTCPNATQWLQIIGTLLGIGFSFHPHDVYEYAINHIDPNLTRNEFKTRMGEQFAFQNLIKRDYNIDTGCLVLSPFSRQKLSQIVTRTESPYWIQVIRHLISRTRQRY